MIFYVLYELQKSSFVSIKDRILRNSALRYYLYLNAKRVSCTIYTIIKFLKIIFPHYYFI